MNQVSGRIRKRKKTRVNMIEELGKTTNASFIKRVLLCTISISIFAFLLCRSSWHTDSLFPHSLNICFSTALFSAFSRTFERKFMFLVCNGILAILAKSSPELTGSSSSPSPDPELDVLASEAVEGELDVPASVAVEDEGLAHQEKEEPNLQRIRASRAGMKDDEIETEGVIADDKDVNTEEDELEEGEENASNLDATEETAAVVIEDVSTEELNRKIEEFIRKMKEEIQIEAQSQLIAV